MLKHFRRLHVHSQLRQVEALGLIVDAAEKVKEDGDEKPEKGGNGNAGGNHNKKNGQKSKFRSTFFKATETAVIMTSGLAMLGFAGLTYHRLYRQHTLSKMGSAFDGYDPVLEMASGQRERQVSQRVIRHGEEFQNNDTIAVESDAVDHSDCNRSGDWVERPQQKLLNDIISGKAGGRYYVMIGEKGTGKTSMLLHALNAVQGFNVVVVDAHADPEIFRQRLGKALHFEFYEDYWGGLFSLRGPRENTFLDIERVFNVLEEVAVRRFLKLKRPVVVVINSSHLIPEDDEGQKLLTLLQQKAESLSGSGVATILFNSDDYWLYQRLARIQTRMDAINVSDLAKLEALKVLKSLRWRVKQESISEEHANTIYHLVGGRPQHLAAVAGHDDMVAASQQLIDREKQWFLNNCGLLGSDMDDDVMESGKFSVAGMRLAREFVRLEREFGSSLTTDDGSRLLPRIPLWRARQVMTRPDFIRDYDNLNIFTLDSESRVKPDSVVMMHAFEEIVSMPGFEELLESTSGRIDDIESLGRTREINFKDLGGGNGTRGSLILRAVDANKYRLELELPEDDDDDEDLQLDVAERYFWKRRLKSLKLRDE